MNLLSAHKQWATRAEDERFSSLPEMQKVLREYRSKAKTEYYNSSSFHVRAEDEEVIVDLDDNPIKFSNWGFKQLCAKADAPVSFLQTLPAKIAADCLNVGLDRLAHDDVQTLMYNDKGIKLCNSIMTPSFKRIWNTDVVDFLFDLYNDGFRIPPAKPAFQDQKGTRIATEEDVINANQFALSVKVGDLIAPAGLYASDHDMFVFMIDPNRKIDDGSGGGLYRGFFVWNSEVGASVCGATLFLWRHVCANHVVWDASNITNIKIKHIGTANHKFNNEFKSTLLEYKDSSAANEESLIAKARNIILGKDKEEVVDTVLKRRNIKLGKRMLQEAYDSTDMRSDEDGNPRSVYGLIQGLTRLSQGPYCDKMMDINTEAGKLFKLAA